MDIQIVIIGAILIAICAFPFMYAIFKGKSKNRNMARTLQEIAGKNGHRIKTFDNTTRVAIGLDDSERHLYFYRDEGNYGLREHVDLSELRSCRVLKESSGSNGAVQADIEKLVLIFSLTDSSASTKSFLFYDSDKDWQLNGEVAISEKWNSLINSRLKKKNKF